MPAVSDPITVWIRTSLRDVGGRYFETRETTTASSTFRSVRRCERSSKIARIPPLKIYIEMNPMTVSSVLMTYFTSPVRYTVRYVQLVMNHKNI